MAEAYDTKVEVANAPSDTPLVPEEGSETKASNKNGAAELKPTEVDMDGKLRSAAKAPEHPPPDLVVVDAWEDSSKVVKVQSTKSGGRRESIGSCLLSTSLAQNEELREQQKKRRQTIGLSKMNDGQNRRKSFVERLKSTKDVIFDELMHMLFIFLSAAPMTLLMLSQGVFPHGGIPGSTFFDAMANRLVYLGPVMLVGVAFPGLWNPHYMRKDTFIVWGIEFWAPLGIGLFICLFASGMKRDLIWLYVGVYIMGGIFTLIPLPVLQAAMRHREIDNWWDIRVLLKYDGKLEIVKDFMALMAITNSCVVPIFYVLVDVAFFATGLCGPEIQFMRPIFCWFLKEGCDAAFSAGANRLGDSYKVYALWPEQLSGGITNAFSLGACRNWMEVLNFFIVDWIAYAARCLVDTNLGTKLLRWRKPTAPAGVDDNTYRGYAVLVEGYSTRIAFLAILMLYPFANILKYDSMKKLFFYSPDAIYYIMLMFVNDILQDNAAIKLMHKNTNLSYEGFFEYQCLKRGSKMRQTQSDQSEEVPEKPYWSPTAMIHFSQTTSWWAPMAMINFGWLFWSEKMGPFE